MRRLLQTISLLFLEIAMLLAIIFVSSFDINFYKSEYQANNTAEYIGMSEDDLINSTTTLLDYIQDKRDDIVYKATVNGVEREVFDERETYHMVDVKNLYLNAHSVMRYLFIAGLVIFMFLHMRSVDWDNINKSFNVSLFIFVGFLTAIILFCLVDFDAFWLQFHYLFFDNDLFLLDPNVSIMINMFPSSLFFHLVIKIVVVYVLIIMLTKVLLRFLDKRTKHA